MVMADDSLRAGYIKAINYEGAKDISPERQAELRELALEIARDPKFLAIEYSRTNKIVEMYSDGVITTAEHVELGLQASKVFKDYTDHINTKLKEHGIQTSQERTGMGADGKMVTFKVGKCSPDGEFVHVLLSKSEELVTNEILAKSNVQVQIPSAHNPQLVLSEGAKR
jgi:hypothetical protein